MRLKISKSKNAESLYIIKSFRENNKSTSKIIKKLGTMEILLPLHNNNRDDVISWANELAKEETIKELNNSRDIVVEYSQSKLIDFGKRRSYNGGYLFLQDIYYQLGINRICNTISNNHKFEFDLNDILSNLIYSRILQPSSKRSSFSYANTLLEAPKYDNHQCYRALSLLAKEKDYIEAEIYNNSTKVIKRNTGILYYDCTNFFFEIEEADGLKQYGKSKENRPNPIIQMGLFMDGNGLPLAFNITPGNTNEQPTLIPIEKRIMKDFKLSNFVVCTDAGLASTTNRKFNDVPDKSFIVTQSLKKIKDHLRTWALDKNEWSTLNSKEKINLDDIDENSDINTVYYKERWMIENGMEQRLIVSYSRKYEMYQKSIREKQIERAQNDVDNNKSTTHRNPNSHTRFEKEINLTDNGEVASRIDVSLNQERIDYESMYDGFYAVCTTLEDDIASIIKINSRRWEIEESFRIMKTEFKSRPVYLQRDDRIIAHFLTCYLSLLIYRILEQKLENEYTTSNIITTLRTMTFQHIKGEGYIPTYTRTGITDKLHKNFGFRTDYEIITEKNMKNIYKKTKYK